MGKGWLLMTGLVLGSAGVLGYLWWKFANMEMEFKEDDDDDDIWGV